MNVRSIRAAFAAAVVCAAGVAQLEPASATPRRGDRRAAARANADDVATLDGILQAFYDVITGPAGAPRQWARDRSLYIPGVRFVAVEIERGAPRARVVTHAEYVRSANAQMVRLGFFEREIHREVRRYANIAQVFSTYEWRTRADGPVEGRGINSLQLFYDGKRWWIASATWQDESPDTPIPAEFLP